MSDKIRAYLVIGSAVFGLIFWFIFLVTILPTASWFFALAVGLGSYAVGAFVGKIITVALDSIS